MFHFHLYWAQNGVLGGAGCGWERHRGSVWMGGHILTDPPLLEWEQSTAGRCRLQEDLSPPPPAPVRPSPSFCLLCPCSFSPPLLRSWPSSPARLAGWCLLLTRLFKLDFSPEPNYCLDGLSQTSKYAAGGRESPRCILSSLWTGGLRDQRGSEVLSLGSELQTQASLEQCPVPQFSATPPKPELSCLLSSYKLNSRHQ